MVLQALLILYRYIGFKVMGYPKQRRTWWEVREDDRNINVYNERDLKRALDKTGPRDIVVWNDIIVSSTIALTSAGFTLTSQGGAAIVPKEDEMTLFTVAEDLEDASFNNLRVGKGIDAGTVTNPWAKFLVVDGGSIMRFSFSGCTMWIVSDTKARFIECPGGETINRCRFINNYFRIDHDGGSDQDFIEGVLSYSSITSNYIVTGHVNLTAPSNENIMTGNHITSGGIDLGGGLSSGNIVVANNLSGGDAGVTNRGINFVVANNG